MLGVLDPLPHRPQRVLVAGVSGVGKTTLCRRIAERTGLPHTEIDALYHGANWVPRATFEADVAAFTSASRWVTEWQYRPVRELLAERADTLVWLDLPARVATARVLPARFAGPERTSCCGTATPSRASGTLSPTRRGSSAGR